MHWTFEPLMQSMYHYIHFWKGSESKNQFWASNFTKNSIFLKKIAQKPTNVFDPIFYRWANKNSFWLNFLKVHL